MSDAKKCDRCGGSLDSGRIMSMYSDECICMKCKSEEVQRPDYAEAVKKAAEEKMEAAKAAAAKYQQVAKTRV